MDIAMDIGSLLLILALVILVGLFIARPLFDRKAEVVASPSGQSDHQRSALLAEHDRILNALQERISITPWEKFQKKSIQPSGPYCFSKVPRCSASWMNSNCKLQPGRRGRMEAAIATAAPRRPGRW
jgi:hypothetical protein